MQTINKDIENILLNKSFDSLSKSELQIIRTCFENQNEFETAQKILLRSKSLFIKDINQTTPVIDMSAFDKAFQKKSRNKRTKRKSVVLNIIYVAATISLVIFFSFLFKNYQKKPDLALFANIDTVLIENNLIQPDTMITQIIETKNIQRLEGIKKEHNKSIDEKDDNEIYHYDYNDITTQLLNMDFSSIVNNQNQDTINSNNNVNN